MTIYASPSVGEVLAGVDSSQHSRTPILLWSGAILTADTDRFVAFYRDVFDATVDGQFRPDEGMRLTFVKVGLTAEFNVFEVEGSEEVDRQPPIFGRGRLDRACSSGIPTASKPRSAWRTRTPSRA